MSFSVFEAQVDQALKQCRDPLGLVQLAQSPLASDALVTDCFMADEQPNGSVRGLALRAVLAWAVDKLKPSGELDWSDYRWRHYIVLHFPYIVASKSFRELAHLMNVGEKAVFDSRQRALAAVVQLLHDERQQPVDLAGRRHYVLVARYERLSLTEQTLLRILATFRHPIPINYVHQLSTIAGLPDSMSALRNLMASGLTFSNTRRAEIEVRSALRPSIQPLSEPDDRILWHMKAAAFYEGQQDFLEAAHHYLVAMEPVRAAEVAITHAQQISDNMQGEELRSLLGEFRLKALPNLLWCQLNIVKGRLAASAQDVDSAIDAFRIAIQSADMGVKARAYHHLAHVTKQRNVDEALSYYSRCIDLLISAEIDAQLLVQTFIDRAWLRMEQRSAKQDVQDDLERARTMLDAQPKHKWLEIRSDWHNARSVFFNNEGDAEKMLSERWQAWMMASETSDVQRKVNTLHNLGQAYVNQGEYQKALTYLAQCQTLAQESGNRRIHGLCSKTIGACHYFMQSYANAITHYQVAYQTFTEMNQTNWLATTCYDLAEAFAELGQMDEAKRYFDEGVRFATEVGATAFVTELKELAGRYGGFVATRLNKVQRRQQLALDHVAEFGSISNKAYQELAGVKYRTSLKDLNALVEQGHLQRIGEGRGTRYVSAETSPSTNQTPNQTPPAAAN